MLRGTTCGKQEPVGGGVELMDPAAALLSTANAVRVCRERFDVLLRALR